MNKKISKKAIRAIIAQEAGAPFTLRYPCGGEEIAIEVRPLLTMEQKRQFMDAVWNAYFGPDADGAYVCRPYALEPAIRLMTLYFHCPNLQIDPEKDLSEYHALLIATGLYDAVRSALGEEHERLRAETQAYIRCRENERAVMLQLAAKSELDTLLYEVLHRGLQLIDRIAEGSMDPEKALRLAEKLHRLAKSGLLPEETAPQSAAPADSGEERTVTEHGRNSDQGED